MYMYLYVDCLLHLLLSVGFILNQFGIDLIKSNRTSVEARRCSGCSRKSRLKLIAFALINMKRDGSVWLEGNRVSHLLST